MPKEVIFVADIFLDEYQGGAELTSNCIIESSPYEIKKFRSSEVNLEVIKSNKNCFWIFGNYSSLGKKEKMYFSKNESYSIIEYDYKYCKYRSDDLHKFVAGNCECEKDLIGKINSIFLSKSKINWWMSNEQKNHYINKFSFLNKANNLVLSSLFQQKTISNILSLADKPKNNNWLIINSPSWIKNSAGCKEYAIKNNLPYELIWGLNYEDMLLKMSSCKGLIFLPLGKDTCPRITIEAKLLGCDLVLNNNVQHAKEKWFESKDTIVKYLSGREKVFWDEIAKYVE